MKEFLSQKGVEFEERNVTQHPEFAAELRAMGFAGIPVTIVGEQRIAGFDRARIEAALR